MAHDEARDRPTGDAIRGCDSMSTLDRKLLRDLWLMRGQMLAIALVIGCGVAVFVMSRSTLSTLVRTQDSYYERYRFADVFAHLHRAPVSLTTRIAEIPGVAQVQTRIVETVNLDVAGMPEPALGRLVSIDIDPAVGLNGLHLRRGRWLEPDRVGEALVSESFAKAHRLRPGDTVSAVLNGHRRQLRIVGVALSPEYVYQIREGDVLPDDRHFGVLWMSREELAAAFEMQDAFNDVSLTLSPKASLPDVIAQLDRLSEVYGGLGAHDRADQSSHKFVDNEIQELEGMALVIPSIFLAVSAFLLHVTLARLVDVQRAQVALLKAFGYTQWDVGWHYLKLVLLVTAVGIVLGVLAGTYFGRRLAEIYVNFFHFPLLEFHLDRAVVLSAMGVAVLSATAGAWSAVWRAAALPPADAMRPRSPATYRLLLVERVGVEGLMPPAWRMILRQLERRPLKTLSSCLGLAASVAVLVLGYFMIEAVEYVVDLQFQYAERQDLTVALIEPTEQAALDDLRSLPGVQEVSPARSVAARLRSSHRTRRVPIIGIDPDSRLWRIVDIRQRLLSMPIEGVVLSEKLAEVLAIGPGDEVTVEVLDQDRPVRTQRVAGVIDDFEGMNAYMDLRALQRLMHEGDVISGAFVKGDSRTVEALYARLKAAPRVGGVVQRTSMLHSFRQTIGENLLQLRTFVVGFACVITCGVVYNSARIMLAERQRELATLRIIGFSRGEISLLFLGELAVMAAIALPLGLYLGQALGAWVIWLSYDTELFRMPLVITRRTYGFSSLVFLAAALGTGLAVRNMLDRLDLIAVLKAQE